MWSLRIDTLTAVMLVVVTTVSGLVHLYSIGYMEEDTGRPRFFAYLSLFTFAMLALVTADDFVQLFFGWEGVGLASYLLIGFWYRKPSANAAAIKAFIVNRVGDFGFALGIFAVFTLFDSVQYDTVFASAPDHVGETMQFLGWRGRRADADLPAAVHGRHGQVGAVPAAHLAARRHGGPDPVSALIHAATMVTAGVFMVARLSPLFELAPIALGFVAVIGATTAFFAATVGLVQTDIKRVVAYSTCSQLGYMFAAERRRRVSAPACSTCSPMPRSRRSVPGRRRGDPSRSITSRTSAAWAALRKVLPFTWAMMLIGTLSLTGFPFTSGFVSKDAIIEATYAAHSSVGNYAFVLTLIAAVLTSFYSWRLMFLAFEGKPREPKEVLAHAHEPPWTMGVPLDRPRARRAAPGGLFAHLFIGSGQAEFWRGSLVTHERARITRCRSG